jgi:hypothetical protein
VDDSAFLNNGGEGIFVRGGTVSIRRVTLSGNNVRGFAATEATVNISETVAVRNRVIGLLLVNTRATIDSSFGEGSQTGLSALPLDTSLTISNSVFVNNSSVGIEMLSGATGSTRSNNTVIDNATNVVGTLAPLPGL